MNHTFHSLLITPVLVTILVLLIGAFLVYLQTSGVITVDEMLIILVVCVIIVPGLSLYLSRHIFPSKHHWRLPYDFLPHEEHKRKKNLKPHERTDSYWYHDD